MAIMSSVGIDADAAKLDALFADIDKLTGGVDAAIADGMSQLAAIPAGFVFSFFHFYFFNNFFCVFP